LSSLRKRILVSVDPGETRVAVLEAKGTARSDRDGQKGKGQGRSRGRKDGQSKNGDWKVAELYVERRGQRSIVGNI
jgi:ribonuclease G